MSSDTWQMTDHQWKRHPDHPVVDEESAAVLEEALHSLTTLRSAGSEGDAGARLHMLASLMAQAGAVLADAVADARDQDYTWAEIAERLGIAAATARRRFAYAAATRVVPFAD
ncbi:MAG: hypothetical protein ABR540_21920 [Acidimicrobiales bacterium]